MSHHTGIEVLTPTRRKVTIRVLNKKKRDGIPITMVTAYDYTSAMLVDEAGIDMVLVGDSLAQVMLGHEDTVSITLDEMLLHQRSAGRALKHPFRVGDMPFGSYEISTQEAVRNAFRIMKEGRMEAVKIEGGAEMADTVRAITKAGIPVVGHIGLTPQTISQQSGYRIQGRTGKSAHRLYNDAMALQEAGCIAIVLELVPTRVARFISGKLQVPTIGIGAGNGCDGQVLVFHDMLGLNTESSPRFLKRYAALGEMVVDAIGTYIGEVEARSFPDEDHSYPIKDEHFDKFIELVDGVTPDSAAVPA